MGRPKTKTKKTIRTRISVTLTVDEKRLLREQGGSVSAGITKLINYFLQREVH